jgi:hypothetical protein
MPWLPVPERDSPLSFNRILEYFIIISYLESSVNIISTGLPAEIFREAKLINMPIIMKLRVY